MAELTVDGHDLDLSKLDKQLYPADGIAKGEVIEHYRAVAETMLPHLAGRPLTLRRYPDGIDAEGFYQKDASSYFPDWIDIAHVPRRDGRGEVDHVVCDDVATLVYLANQASIEFHVWLARQDRLERPDRMVIDIDPPDGAPVATLREVARRARDLCQEIGLTPYLQATGGRGFHVAAPLDRAAGFEAARDLAAGLADLLAARDPELLTTAQRKQRRGDRIFLDVNRNAYGQTFIAPYSLRSRPGAPAATPLDWSELGRAEPNSHDIRRIRQRLGRKGDPWADMDAHAASVDAARRQLRALPR